MTTIQAQVPDPLARQLAEQEKIILDHLVKIALAYQVSVRQEFLASLNRQHS